MSVILFVMCKRWITSCSWDDVPVNLERRWPGDMQDIMYLD